MQVPFNAYIDGFNLYMGSLKQNPTYKWLDIVEFCSQTVPEAELNEIHYFTARVKERFPGDLAPIRQHAYLRVLEDQGVHVHLGKFRKGSEWMRVTATQSSRLLEPALARHFGLTEIAFSKARKNASPDLPKARVERFEEKGSDVNLASLLLRDAYLNGIQMQLVVTGDSDLLTPIRFAVEHGVTVHSLVPNPKQRVDALALTATSVNFVDLNIMQRSQLPEVYKTSKGSLIRRPEGWG